MKIIVCCKVVPEEQDIAVNSDRSVNVSRAAAKISQYDLNAIECAVQLAGDGGEVVALSAGSHKWLDNSKIRKDILSRGPASLEMVVDDSLENALPDVTAEVLAAAARRIGFDLVLCGEGSGDLYAQQVGLLLGEKLGAACINAVQSVSVSGNVLTVERALEDVTEVLEMPLPAVLSLTSDINVPKIPTMKAILAAGKKPSSAQDCAALGVSAAGVSVMNSVRAPEQADRLNNIIEGDSEENIAAFVDNVRKALQ